MSDFTDGDIKENLDHIAKWNGTAWKALDPGVRGMYQMAEIEDAQIAARDAAAKQLISAGNALIEKLDKLIIFDERAFALIKDYEDELAAILAEWEESKKK